ncbi:MAG: serine/threonine protein kinase, partial [Alphaproteobacteria bacterium]
FGLSYLAAKDAAGKRRHVVLREYMPAGLATRRSDSYAVRPLRASDRPDFEWGLTRLRHESQALAALEHPSLARVAGLVEENGTGYLAEEYVEGQSLASILERRGKLPEAEIRYLLGPLLDALDEVHRIGLVHGGIEPAAIVFRSESVPVLVGFGAPQPAPPPTGDTSWSAYTPHELCNSSASVGPWTDIYAFAAVLYRAVTGEAPPSGPARKDALDRGASDPLVPFASLKDYSPVLLGAIMRALAPVERERPQSLAAWRALLSRTVNGYSAAQKGASAKAAKADQPALFDLDTAKSKPPSGTREMPPLKGGIRRRRAPLPDTPPPVEGPPVQGSAMPGAGPRSPGPPLLGAALTATLASAPMVPLPPRKPAAPRRSWIWGATFAVVVVAGFLGWRNYQGQLAPTAAKPGNVEHTERLAADRRRTVEVQRVAVEDVRKAAEAKKAEELEKAEDVRKVAEARQAEEARKAEEARQAEERKKAEEAKRAEEARLAEAARLAEEAARAERERAEAQKAERERLERERASQLSAAIPKIDAALGRKDWTEARKTLIEAERLAPGHAKLAEFRGKLVAEAAARVARADEA